VKLVALIVAVLFAAPAAADAARVGCEEAAGPPMAKGAHAGHRVSITYDEYLDPQLTPRILRTLDRFGMSGTFFAVGANAAYYPELAASVLDHGNELGNHSWSHVDLTAEPDAGLAQYGDTQQAIADATGFTPCLARPPFGAFDPAVLDSASTLGLRTVLWSVFPGMHRHARHAARYTLRRVHPGSIILLHQTRSNVRALPRILRGLERKGLRSVPAVKLLGGRFTH
jgi:peptidoglycan/xylan/chitin deacetylase (PgdA/CDA1 family)